MLVLKSANKQIETEFLYLTMPGNSNIGCLVLWWLAMFLHRVRAFSRARTLFDSLSPIFITPINFFMSFPLWNCDEGTRVI